jgi:hypothetical protein
VGISVGAGVADNLGYAVGGLLGVLVGSNVGLTVGKGVGSIDGDTVGCGVTTGSEPFDTPIMRNMHNMLSRSCGCSAGSTGSFD